METVFRFRDRAEARARELLDGSQWGAVPGWRLRKGGPVELVFPDDLARLAAAGNLSLGGVLEALGTQGAKKFREFWAKEGARSLVHRGSGAAHGSQAGIARAGVKGSGSDHNSQTKPPLSRSLRRPRF